MPLALLFVAIISVASFASSVSVTTVSVQTKYGSLTDVFFETASGPSGPTPSTNTALTPSVGSGSYVVNNGATAYLWSPQFGGATTIGPGKWVLDFWTAPSSYVAITITNAQTSATPVPFQQRISWNPSSYTAYEASDLGNIRFYSDKALTTPLYAWLESCTPSVSNTATSATAWVKLTSPISPNGGTVTIYMAFLSTNTSYDGVYWGEAPNLSGTYGQYDNGAYVFTQYGGASWSSFTTYEGTWDTTNGYLEQTSSASLGFSGGGPAALITSATYPNNGQYIIETAFSYGSQAVARVGLVAVAGLNVNDPLGYRLIGQQSSNGAGFVSFLNDLVAWVVNGAYAGSVDTAYTMQVVNNAGTWGGTLFSGYGIGGSALATLASTAYTAANQRGSTSGYVGVSAARFDGTNTDANPAKFQWFRLRAYPPNNVMPTASFGSLGGPSSTPSGVLNLASLTLANSQGTAIAGGSQIMVNVNWANYASYLDNPVDNYVFFNSTGGLLYSWLESGTSNTATNAIVWLKTDSAGIGATSSVTYYLGFYAKGTNVLGKDNATGEAPQLSGTYGQYDNGAYVFTQYGGASWSSFTTYEGTWDTTNGYLEQTSSASLGFGGGGPAALITSTSYPDDGQYIIETAFSYSSQAVARVGILAVAGLSAGDPVGYRFIGQQLSDGPGFVSFLNDLVVWAVSGAYGGFVDTAYTMQIVDNAGTWSGGLFSGYGIGGSSLASLASTGYATANKVGGTTGYVGVSAARFDGTNIDGNPAKFQWFRLRTYPPNNVMPTASFGGVTFLPNRFLVSLFVTDSSGGITSTIASNVLSPTIGTTEAQYTMTFAGGQVNVPANGYLMVSLSAGIFTSYVVYWGTGQPTNFQVPYRVLS